MRIDDGVEALVRSALDAAVHRDLPRFDAALRAVDDQGKSASAVELVLAVCAAVLFETHDGRPSPEQTVGLAEAIGRQEQWASVATSEVESLLNLVVAQDVQGVPASSGKAAVVAFVTAANLLTTASEPDRGEWWFTYLDKVEAAIEAAG